MNTLFMVIAVIVMAVMSVLPLFIVMYLGSDRSITAPLVLAAALVGGAFLGASLAVAP